MSTIQSIRKGFADAVVERCYDQGCLLKLGGLSSYVVLKGERIVHDRKVCDCIVFLLRDIAVIGLVELKSNTVHASEIEAKLENAKEAALDIMEKCSENCPELEFIPLVLFKSCHPSEYVRLTEVKVTARGKTYHAVPKKCGVFFSQLLLDIGVDL